MPSYGRSLISRSSTSSTTSVIKVDFIVRKNTEYRRLEFERRRPVTVDDIEIWIVSKEDLIISKLYWAKDSHSEFQLRDVKNLLKSGYDDMYLQTWTEKLGFENAWMNDTPPEIEKKVYEMMMARSGAERLLMGALMFDAAREIVLASLPKDLPEEELKRRLFERIYGAPREDFLDAPAKQPRDEQPVVS